MKLFGLEITKAAPMQSVVENRGGWWPLIREANSGDWQRNITVNRESVLAYDAVFACMTLIAGDIAKNRVKLVAKDANGIWSETATPAYSPVLRKPNGYQNRIQFIECWVLSKLSRGNAYILKQRDNRNVVTALYVLDPNRVQPMVTPDGEVYYQLSADNMAGLEAEILVPASEIIHDRFNCLFHPLVGVSPIFANGLAATQGLSIQQNAANLFGNGSKPGGLLVAPGRIDPENAGRLKEYWDTNFSGKNFGKIAVLGDGMKYEGLSITPVDAQLIEQLKWTAEIVCSTFHVPPYKIGVGVMPTYNNIQSLNVEYYSQCLQIHFESMELCLDEGLGIGDGVTIGSNPGITYGTEFDTDNLLRMDTVTQMDALDKAIGSGALAPNEGRKRFLDLPPVDGGETPYLQQQNYSLAALAKRDAQSDPFGTAAPTPAPDPAANDNAAAANAARALRALRKGLADVRC